MTIGRKRLAGAVVTLGIAALGGSVLNAAPSNAEPSISDVKDQVDQLYHEAEQASERYNDAKLRLDQAQTRLGALQQDLDRQSARVDAVRRQVAANVVSQYQTQALSTAAEVVLSDDPDAFLSQLTTVSQYNDTQTQVVTDLTEQIAQLERRQSIAGQEIQTIAAAKKTLAEQKSVIDEKAAKAKALLGRMQDAAARAAQASRSGVRVPMSAVPASGRAAIAVRYALAQVGDAYVWGAAGPDAFDCSGLMMAAWGQAGVSLPHSSSAQHGYGTPVSSGDLRPGDLVFYYSPISHVGMYIGNGMVVHAANPGEGVRVAPVFSMPYSGAVRPG